MVESVRLDLARMQARKGEVVTANVKGVEFLFKKNKVTWLKGEGRIAGAGQGLGRRHRVRDQAHRHRHRQREHPAAGRRGGREDDRQLHRRARAGPGAGPHGGDRRRLYRAGAGQRVAAAGRGGDRGRVPGPPGAGHGRRDRQDVRAGARQAGHQVQAEDQGDRRRDDRAGRAPDAGAGRGRRGADAGRRRGAGRDRPPALLRGARPGGARAWRWTSASGWRSTRITPPTCPASTRSATS